MISSRFNIFLLSLLIAIAFLLPQKVLGQSGQQAQGQMNKIFQGDDGSFIEHYFVDELSLQLTAEATPLEGYIDSTTYKLGPYDLLSIETEGSVTFRLRGIGLNAQGDVILPSVGKIRLEGLTLAQAQKKVEQHYQDKFENIDVNISLDKPRLQTVHITGDISKSGKYYVPAQTRVSELISRVFKSMQQASQLSNSLSERGRVAVSGNRKKASTEQGTNDTTSTSVNLQTEPTLDFSPRAVNQKSQINQIYSLRKITIRHRNGTRDTADLISYYRTGNLEDNPYVQDGDQINLSQITRWTSNISISGAVNSPMEAEYRTKDSLSHLIEMGGGFAPDADTSKVFVYRKFDNNVHKVTVKSADFGSFSLQPNDRIVVPTDHSKQVNQTAIINGEVANPGKYPIVEGETTVYDLLEMAGGQTQEALPNGSYMTRSIDNINKTEGINEQPDQLNTNLLKRTAMQNLEGFQYLNLEAAVSAGNVPVDLTNEEKLKDLKIYDGDKLYIPRNTHTVFVFGQVNEPGYYSFNTARSVTGYIDAAGGFALPAESNEVFVVKAGSRTWYKPSETNIQSGDMIFVNRKPFQSYTEKQNLTLQYNQMGLDSLRLELEERRQRNDTIRLILTGISTITGFVTTYIVLTR